MSINKIKNLGILDSAVTTAKIADDAITLVKMASGTDGNLISYDASGNPVAVATGSDGQVLTSTGAGSPPVFETLSSGGLGVAGQFRFTSNFANAGNGATEDITANLEENDTSYSRVGSAITQSSGIFTFPSTGIYLVTALVWFEPTSASSGVSLFIKATTDNSSYADLAKITTGSSGSNRPEVITANAMFDVTDVSTHKIKFATNGGTYITYQGSSTINNNSFTFLKLGET